MQLGLTWPLQRLLHVSVPYGPPVDRGFCWDAHCITLRGKAVCCWSIVKVDTLVFGLI